MRPHSPAVVMAVTIGLSAACSQPRDIVFAGRAGSPPDSASLEIFTMRPDGTGRRQLTAGGPNAASNFPVWSPDGQQIAFLRRGAVYLMDKNGDQERLLAQLDGAGAGYPEWSPDGQSILFTENNDSLRAVTGFYQVRVDGGAVNRVPLEPGRYGSGGWHPEGLWFYTHRYLEDGNTDIIRVTVATGEMVSVLTSDSLRFEGVSMSPDATTLLVQGGTLDPISVHVFVMAPDGTGLRALTSASGIQNNSRCSHDGTHVVMQCNPEELNQGPLGRAWFETFEVCTVALDGTNYRRLTRNADPELHPDW